MQLSKLIKEDFQESGNRNLFKITLGKNLKKKTTCRKVEGDSNCLAALTL